MMRKRYEIQACDLVDTARKSQVVWHNITTAWTEKGAFKKYKSVKSFNDDPKIILRVFDRKVGRAIA